jgi:hypothetical protein
MGCVLVAGWQLSHTATGLPFPMLRPTFVIGNASLYLSFLLIVTLSATVLSRLQVLRALFYLLGTL